MSIHALSYRLLNIHLQVYQFFTQTYRLFIRMAVSNTRWQAKDMIAIHDRFQHSLL